MGQEKSLKWEGDPQRGMRERTDIKEVSPQERDQAIALMKRIFGAPTRLDDDAVPELKFSGGANPLPPLVQDIVDRTFRGHGENFKRTRLRIFPPSSPDVEMHSLEDPRYGFESLNPKGRGTLATAAIDGIKFTPKGMEDSRTIPRTMIHEMAHMLGLPDDGIYSYTEAANESNPKKLSAYLVDQAYRDTHSDISLDDPKKFALQKALARKN